jgi:hypothetical protein
MNALSHVLAAIALMASAVIYGTDVFCAMVQRPALARVSDAALTNVMGRVHQYGDGRLPLPGALGITAAALAAITAVLAGQAAASAAAAAAVTAQALWLIIYLRISALSTTRSLPPPRPGTSRPTHAPCSASGTVSSPPAPSCRRSPSPRCAPPSPLPNGPRDPSRTCACRESCPWP